MILEFRVKEHYGRQDFYPENEQARLILEFKRLVAGPQIKCLKRDELALLERLGHQIKIIQSLETI